MGCLGFVLGVVIVLCIISLIYIFGRKFATQGKFFNSFNSINKIGVIKPEYKRSKFASFIDKTIYLRASSSSFNDGAKPPSSPTAVE